MYARRVPLALGRALIRLWLPVWLALAVAAAGCDQSEPSAAAPADPTTADPTEESGGAAVDRADREEPAPVAAAAPDGPADQPAAREEGPAAAAAPGSAEEAAEEAADEAPAPVPPDPWAAAECLPVAVDGPRTVLCRDTNAAQEWARSHGEAVPEHPRAAGSLADPIPVTEGLPLYRSIRKKIAPLAKFTPILFHETPPFAAEQWAWFAAHPKHWETARTYWKNPQNQVDAYKKLVRALKEDDRETLRHLLLRNGYVYTEDRRLGRRIYKTVRLNHLFDEDEIWLQRGDVVYRLVKDQRRGYVHADGLPQGRKAAILLFDRVATTREAFATTYHWDLQAVRHGLGLYTIQLEDTRPAAVDFASSFLSGEPVQGVLFHQDGRTAVALAALPPERFAALYDDNRRRFRARDRILDAAEAFADEWIKFDEPDIEFGQEDGVLRDRWEEAYRAGKDRYEYNGVEYRVFDGEGTPKPPQVCIDFLMDAMERASGTWWRAKGEPRTRTKGTLDWRGFDRLAARSVPRVVKFAKQNPDKFEVYEVPVARQIEFRHEDRFYRNLETFPVDFREADIIVIWGYREDQKRHYHSFFVHAIDPVDGFPIILSDNAGLAAVRVWNDVMKTAPKRYVYRRLRLVDSWLLALGMGDERKTATADAE